MALEPELSEWFRKTEYIDYVSADLFNPRAMVRMDITDIQYRDNTFDVIYCSHVLEHVLDDKRPCTNSGVLSRLAAGRFFRCRSPPT